jgi:hypothetical protein
VQLLRRSSPGRQSSLRFLLFSSSISTSTDHFRYSTRFLLISSFDLLHYIIHLIIPYQIITPFHTTPQHPSMSASGARYHRHNSPPAAPPAYELTDLSNADGRIYIPARQGEGVKTSCSACRSCRDCLLRCANITIAVGAVCLVLLLLVAPNIRHWWRYGGEGVVGTQ